MHYLFIDESWQSHELLKVSAIIVPQEIYSQAVAVATFQSAKERLERIDAFLESVKGVGVVYQTDLRENWLTEKAYDSSSDIRRLSRTDNVWSWAVTLATMGVVIRLERRGSVLSTVDIYHDPKSLTTDRRQVLYQHLRRDVVQGFKRLDVRFRAPRLRNASIRRIQEVPKVQSREKPNKFQRGVWLADQLMCDQDLLSFGVKKH